MALMGYLLPGFWLSRKIKARQKVITNGLPDALDLMIVCLEAGSAMDQAENLNGVNVKRDANDGYYAAARVRLSF